MRRFRIDPVHRTRTYWELSEYVHGFIFGYWERVGGYFDTEQEARDRVEELLKEKTIYINGDEE
jgi:hypothetical protein